MFQYHSVAALHPSAAANIHISTQLSTVIIVTISRTARQIQVRADTEKQVMTKKHKNEEELVLFIIVTIVAVVT